MRKRKLKQMSQKCVDRGNKDGNSPLSIFGDNSVYDVCPLVAYQVLQQHDYYDKEQ